MTFNTEIKVVGLSDALKTLNKIEPQLRKQFEKDVRQIAKPAIDQAAQAYKYVPLSGMTQKWDGTGVERRKTGRISTRNVFPLVLEKARKGLGVKFDTRSKATSTILIQQNDAGWAIFETAGRKTNNPLGQQLGILQPKMTRLFGRVVFAMRPKIEEEMAAVAKKIVNKVNSELL